MALKRLPNDVQSMLCASAQVNSFKRAIEELVYNSLDAESTSIAIRINIQEKAIQVIDNGCGITKHDFNIIGQRYVTSKLTELSTLKAAPKKYGYRGEFFANIITVSEIVKITSRHENTEETWAKTFQNGKEKKFTKMSTRPTKGTTVDIKHFLYNLNIQKRQIDPVSELQNTKAFLEQLSLVHNNISLSLRDDSKNEIIFKVHKKRDIYQTLSTLFDIDKVDVLELEVEKNEYKVKGLIGKMNKELELYWIFLNGKFMYSNSRLHNIVNEYLKNYLNIRDHRKLKSKKNNDENQLFDQNIPFYFIFITCPYIDYDISFTSKQSVVQFKNWEQINKLLEKLVKFYNGDVNLKEIKKPKNGAIITEQNNVQDNQETRDKVKEIMDKILGNHSKKLGVSQLQNGVKGKKIKRKTKKKTAKLTTNILNFIHENNNKSIHSKRNISENKLESTRSHNPENQIKILDKELNMAHDKDKNDKDLRISKKADKQTDSLHSKKYKLNNQGIKKKKITKTIIIQKTNKKIQEVPNKQKYINENEHKNQKNLNDNCNKLRGVPETNSVCKLSRIVAQKAEKFLQHHTTIRKVKKNENINKKFNRNMYARKLYYNSINNTNILPPNINNKMIDKFILDKLKKKTFKTTYDLVQTILMSQMDVRNEINKLPAEMYSEFSDFNYRPNEISHYLFKIPRTTKWTNKQCFEKHTMINDQQKEITHTTTSASLRHKTYEYVDNLDEYSNKYVYKMPDESVNNNDIYCKSKIINERKEILNYSLSGILSSKLTYESHRYEKNKVYEQNENMIRYKTHEKQNVRFITKKSKDNFLTSFDCKNNFKRPTKSTKKGRQIYDTRMEQTIDKSFTINYSKSNKNDQTNAQNDLLANSLFFAKDEAYVEKYNYDERENESINNEQNSVYGITYTIEPTNDLINIKSQVRSKCQYFDSDSRFDTYSIHNYEANINNATPKIETKEKSDQNINNFNIVFVSKSQSEPDSPHNNLEPINVCETILQENGSVEREFAFSFNENQRLNDSLYGNTENFSTNKQIEKDYTPTITKLPGVDITENVSYHFNVDQTKPDDVDGNIEFFKLLITDNNNSKVVISPKALENANNIKYDVNIEKIDCNFKDNNFNFKNRLRFVPKGMSQLFKNSRSKTLYDYNLDKEYYENSIYNNFANDVQVNTEIYEPIIQNVEDLTTKDIHKFQNKVKKDNASLIFDETSLKEAKVLGQVDCKFIIAIMKNRSGVSGEAMEYLILFDQHAVHERIRLETNLSDYIIEDRWTSVPLDNIVLKMTKDQILYLHNYKDKFYQLGLQWTILNDNEVTINSIPEAILGKNPREVEKVIKAVKNLVVEEINVIKSQKGCVSLYPKSIMDLVFSEACRYAIKFGDPLSKSDCVDLLNALSDCKTPFQCAHGRPVMAVILDIKSYEHEYKVSLEKLARFKPKKTETLK